VCASINLPLAMIYLLIVAGDNLSLAVTFFFNVAARFITF
jgi:hypothetical protein